MRVNIVVKRGWILERLAREIERGIPGVVLNMGQQERVPDPGATLNYYLPAKDVLKFRPPTRAIGLFTHGEILPEVLEGLAAATAMNHGMGFRLTAAGASDVTVIIPGTEPARRPPVFGVMGRPYSSGRKGEDMVSRAMEAGFRFVACCPAEKIRATKGTQWPCPVTHTTEQREAFYRNINYLVVPSLDEGGPMPVLEALARHVPVIAPDVGFCWEFPVIRYERGSWPSLLDVLTKLQNPPTWASWAEEHRKLFHRLGKRAA